MRSQIPKLRRGRSIALVSAAALGVGASAGVSAVALASEQANDASLSIVSGGTTFFTPEGVSEYWAGWIAEFAGMLPDGATLPASPTTFFETDDEHELFEDGLPQAILSRVARCAWLEVVLDESASAAAMAKAGAQLGRYAEFPGVAAGLDVPKYERDIREAAREAGVSAERWEHEIECEPSEPNGDE